MNDKRTFGSKTDLWFIAVSAVNAAIALFLSWTALTDGYAWTDIPFAGGLTLFGVIIPGWMFARTRYTLDGTSLTIRCGPILNRIPLEAITAATLNRSFAPAPALSNDRVRIDYRTKRNADAKAFISPRDRDGFLADLSRRMDKRSNT